MQELNEGILKIYEKVPSQSEGGKPVDVLKPYKRAWFGYVNFSVSEHYAAKQSNTKVEKRVQILQDKALSNLHVIVIKKQQYQVGRVDHGKSRSGRPMTYITLERVTQQYDIK